MLCNVTTPRKEKDAEQVRPVDDQPGQQQGDDGEAACSQCQKRR
jgi:hypothetical protein